MREKNNSNLLSKYISQQDTTFEDIELIESTNEEVSITGQNNTLGWIILIIIFIMLIRFL